MLLLAAWMSVLAAGGAPFLALAGPRASAPDDTQPSSVVGAMAFFHALAVHRLGPVADRARITLTLPDGATRTEELLVRVSPHDGGEVRLETDSLLAWFGQGEGIAVHPNDPTTVVRWSIPERVTSSVLADCLPPLPLPQVPLAIDDAGRLALTPYTRDVEWLTASIVRAENGRFVRLVGRTASGRAELDVALGRVAGLSVELPTAAGPALLDVTFEPVPPGDPRDWRIDAERRRAVPSITGLRALEPPVRIGSRFPSAPFYDGTVEAGAPDDAHYTAVLLVRNPAEAWWWPEGNRQAWRAVGEALEGVTAFRRELTRRALSQPRIGGLAAGPRVEARIVAVLEPGAETVARFSALRDEWISEADPGDARLLWTPSERRTIDRMAPFAPAALVLLDRERTVLAVVEVPVGADEAAAELLAGSERSAAER